MSYQVLNADGLLIETQPTWQLATMACWHLAVQGSPATDGLCYSGDFFSVEANDRAYTAYSNGTSEPRIVEETI